MTSNSSQILEYNKDTAVVTKILAWYDVNKRTYPWRKNITPYRMLITEILLRKTTRNQVQEIFPLFFKKFPTLTQLHQSTRREIEKTIRPLGMEKIRGKLLKRLAKIIVKKYNGRIPSTKEELLELPGVGVYTVNAVLCISKKQKLPLVDTNSKRIVERIFLGKYFPKKRIDSEIYQMVDNLLPQKRFVDFNLALLDFANSVCLAKKPKCGECPVKRSCRFYKLNSDVSLHIV